MVTPGTENAAQYVVMVAAHGKLLNRSPKAAWSSEGRVPLAVGAGRPPTQVKSSTSPDRSKDTEAPAEDDETTWPCGQLSGAHESCPVGAVVGAASVARTRKTRVAGTEKRLVGAWGWWLGG